MEYILLPLVLVQLTSSEHGTLFVPAADASLFDRYHFIYYMHTFSKLKKNSHICMSTPSSWPNLLLLSMSNQVDGLCAILQSMMSTNKHAASDRRGQRTNAQILTTKHSDLQPVYYA